MLRLTFRQLKMAAMLARHIHAAEEQKECAKDHVLHLGDGNLFSVPVPATVVLSSLNEVIAESHKKMAELGIELLPD